MALLINRHMGIWHHFDETTVVGRTEDCRLPLKEPTISKRHLNIFSQGGKWYAEDLGSANFSYVNGEKISRCELQDGDYIRLDVIPLIFFVKDPPQLPELIVANEIGATQQCLPITKPALWIGRHLTGTHILISDPSVSGVHLQLIRHENQWFIIPAKPGVSLDVNQKPVKAKVEISPGDKIRIGSTLVEVSVQTIQEWYEVSRVRTRLQELLQRVRVQTRTLDEAVREHVPSYDRGHEWAGKILEIFSMVDQSIRQLDLHCEVLRVLVPALETETDDVAAVQTALRASRRFTNLANYLDVLLHKNKLLQIQNSDLTTQQDLISKLYDDVQGCITSDNPTLRL